MKVLLTSTGLENKNIEKAFNELLDKPCGEVRALFIPTALNTEKARTSIPLFREDLLKAGIPEENIFTYDLDIPLVVGKGAFDVIYVCPGDPEYLLERLKAVQFLDTLKHLVHHDSIYLGVSAGSDIAAINYPDGLGLVDIDLETHAEEGSTPGEICTEGRPHIGITDNQAVLVKGTNVTLIK